MKKTLATAMNMMEMCMCRMDMFCRADFSDVLSVIRMRGRSF